MKGQLVFLQLHSEDPFNQQDTLDYDNGVKILQRTMIVSGFLMLRMLQEHEP